MVIVTALTDSYMVATFAYPNLLGTKRLGCCCLTDSGILLNSPLSTVTIDVSSSSLLLQKLAIAFLGIAGVCLVWTFL
jgi:hypothetical protein